MGIKFTESDLRARINLYKKQGIAYTITKLEREFAIRIFLKAMPSSKSYAKDGEIHLGVIQDEPLYDVLFHELQHMEHFLFDNANCEGLIIPYKKGLFHEE